MICDGGALDPECFGLTGAACPDLSLCNIQGLTGFFTNPVGITTFQVGELGDGGTTTATFGDYSSYNLQSFKTYATNVEIGAISQYLTRVGIGGYYTLDIGSPGSTAHRVLTLNGGRQNYLTSGGFRIDASGSSPVEILTTSGAANIQFASSLGIIQSSATNEITTNLFRVGYPDIGGSDVNWLVTELSTGLICNASIPHLSATGTPEAYTNMRVEQPLVIAEGMSILTEESDGKLRMSGFSLCNGQVHAESGVELDLFSDIGINLNGPITNPTSMSPLVIADTEGLDLQDTPVFNSDAMSPAATSYVGAGHVVVNDDLRVTGDVEFGGTARIDSILSVGGTATFSNIIVTGNVQAGTLNTNIIGGDPCCDASDVRIKHSIRPIEHGDSWERILNLKPVEYRFNKEYLATDKWVKDHIHRGFIAQDVKQVIPGAVSTVEKKVGDIHYPDFHRLHLEKIVPDLVGALKAAHARIDHLESKIDKLLQQKKE